MKRIKIFAMIMAVVLAGSHPISALAENVENVSEETQIDNSETESESQTIEENQNNEGFSEGIDQEIDGSEDESSEEETMQSDEIRDQSDFLENSFRYSNGELIESESIAQYASRDSSQAYKKINGISSRGSNGKSYRCK